AGRPIRRHPKIGRSTDGKIADAADDTAVDASYGRLDGQPPRRNRDETALGSLGTARRCALRCVLPGRGPVRPRPTPGKGFRRAGGRAAGRGPAAVAGTPRGCGGRRAALGTLLLPLPRLGARARRGGRVPGRAPPRRGGRAGSPGSLNSSWGGGRGPPPACQL